MPGEHNNKFGTCDLQTATKVLNLAAKLGRTPRRIEVEEEYGPKGRALIALVTHRVGGYNEYCESIGLTSPEIYNHNQRYNKDYFIEKALNALCEGYDLNAKQIFTSNEYKAIRYHFGSVKTWRGAVLEEVKAME